VVGVLVLPDGGTGTGLRAAPVADSVQQRKDRLDHDVAAIRQQLEGTSADLVEAAVTLRRSQAQLADARVALGAARARLVAARSHDQDLADGLALARAEEAKAGRELGDQRRDEAGTRVTLGRIARRAYQQAGVSDLGALAVLLDARSPQDLGERMVVAGTALRVQDGAIERLRVQQSEIRARQARLAAVRAEVADLKQQSEAQVALRDAAERAATAAEAEVGAVVARQARAVAVIAARKAAELARQTALEAEQARLRAALRERARRAAEAQRRRGGGNPPGRGAGSGSGGGHDYPAQGGGVLARPATGPITSPYGMRYHPIFHVYKLHTGTDFGVPCGTPVHAARGGAYGNSVVLDHGIVNGVSLVTTYNHLSRIDVHSGSVGTGRLLGLSGTTGASTGCHLHFEVLVNGSFTNPMNWL
jgi:murein DD-endopeptidase MepM/ murein hydrolase activator NlpD